MKTLFLKKKMKPDISTCAYKYIESQGKVSGDTLNRTLWRGAWDEEEVHEESCSIYIIRMFCVENIFLYYLAKTRKSEENKWKIFSVYSLDIQMY